MWSIQEQRASQSQPMRGAIEHELYREGIRRDNKERHKWLFQKVIAHYTIELINQERKNDMV